MITKTEFAPSCAFLREMLGRGYVHQCLALAELDLALTRGVVTAYIGFDATADSLHVGHLLSIMALRRLQLAGHRPIVLMGGGTTRIGDPSFRDTSRPLLDDTQIANNIAGIRRVFERFLQFGEGPSDAIMVNNADWLDRLGYIDFLRECGTHFTINRMLSFDSVKIRLEREQSLTFLEFNYMLLQAYDFVELARRHGCTLQMGGSDQWGNIVNGIELGRRIDGRDLFGLTTNLLTTASGAKMGKTANGAVWLNAERLSPYDFWQFWRNTEDADIGRFLRLFTELDEATIVQLETAEGHAINAAKIVLANEVTTLLHGAAAAAAAQETAYQAFGGGVAEGLPEIVVDHQEWPNGLPLVDALVRAGLAASKGEARRLIVGGGARVDGKSIADTTAVLPAHSGMPLRLSAGRKKHVLVRINP